MSVAAGYLDILDGRNVLNGSFQYLIDVDKTVCAKNSVDVASKEQLRQ